jgi:hypothetical protein
MGELNDTLVGQGDEALAEPGAGVEVGLEPAEKAFPLVQAGADLGLPVGRHGTERVAVRTVDRCGQGRLSLRDACGPPGEPNPLALGRLDPAYSIRPCAPAVGRFVPPHLAFFERTRATIDPARRLLAF